MTSRIPRLGYLILVTGMILVNRSAYAEDWPQWMGVNRDAVWTADSIVAKFPDNGPSETWRVEIGNGYAGPAVVGDRVYVTDYITDGDQTPSPSRLNELDGRERILCLDAKTGDQIWMYDYACKYKVSYPAGPRVTPTVAGGLVFTLGTMGDFYCLNAENGDVVWSRDFMEEYGAPSQTWGFCGHPLVDGDTVYCLVGGEGSVAVAFDKNTGDEKWRALSSKQTGYCPPTMIEIGGEKQLVIYHATALNGLDPQTGEVYWSVPMSPEYGMSIAAPRQIGNLVFAGGYGNNCAMVRLADDGREVEVVWEGARGIGIGPVNATPLVDGDFLYGVGRRGDMVCFRADTGEHQWRSFEAIEGERPRDSGTAFLIKQGDRYFVFNEDGELIIARLSAEGYEEIDRAKIIDPTTNAHGRQVVWSHPAFANRSVFVRNDGEIVCVNLSNE